MAGRYRGPRTLMSVVRELLIVGSSVALFCRVVVLLVVVVDSVVVVQPTNAITQTPKTNGINFFISPF